jgi:5-methylcytosine-specific restriction endonuclease McrA
MKFSPEHCAALSASKMGAKNPMFGKPGSRLGKHASAVTRERMSSAQIRRFQDPEQRQIAREGGLGKTQSPETIQKRVQKCSGPKHYNWRGGTSRAPYSLTWTVTLRRKIRERDNYTCQFCGKRWVLGTRAFPVHHIDYNRKRCVPENLVTMCLPCHVQMSPSKEFWTGLFQSAISLGYLHGGS